ncbi:UDP-Glycosyltransferase/glycogen phosphorylase [Ceratobasidium sp. AG-I]|nr:UDP-Glycosyltransferase/glycogen phosphorylase [Ceratobasidium sp. AG-I]
MTNSPLKHIVFVAGLSWTHLYPALKFTIRTIERFPNAFISVFVHGPLASQALRYLSAQSFVSQQRIRIVSSVSAGDSSDTSTPDIVETITAMEKRFALWITNEIKAAGLRINELEIESPSWIIEDNVNGGISLASKAAHSLPVMAWWIGPAASLTAHTGSAEYGHGGRLLENVAAAYKRDGLANGKTFEDIYNQELTSRLVCVPGLPPCYDHEQVPQLISFFLPIVSEMVERWTNMLNNVDYITLCTTYEIEPVAIRTFMHALSKPITPFFVGPAVDLPSPAVKKTKSTDSPESQFLDRAYTELGAHSVVYIAFGTGCFPFPESIGHLSIILEEIVVHGYRVLFALLSATSKGAGLNTRLIDEATAAGQTMFTGWTDQAGVLEHPAIHYFLTHAGRNSTIESIVRGVPMIFWPFSSDQPVNAMQIATQHDCGFELIQVRTGPARSVAYQQDSDVVVHGTNEAVRNEINKVLALSKGPRGVQQRRNTKALGEVVMGSLATGGSGDENLGRLGMLLGLTSA